MNPVRVPTMDVNDERGVLVAWKVDDRTLVEKGQSVAVFETSKAVVDVLAPIGGYLLRECEEGAAAELSVSIGVIFSSQAEIDAYKARSTSGTSKDPEPGPNATLKARERAAELGIDISLLSIPGLITVKHVEDAARRRSPVDLPTPLLIGGVERVLLIGAGLGANQVISIFCEDRVQRAVAIVDDDPSKWGKLVYGVPVCGGSDRIIELFEQKLFDTVVIAIGSSVQAREKFRRHCNELGVPLTNAVDRTVRISSDVTFGRGNVILAFCHFGAGTVVGDNNFLSAYNSFDHHNVLGSDICTGPGCMTSGLVEIGDRCRFGTGIFIQPRVKLGDDVRVASGAVIVNPVAGGHTVKTRIVTTVVVPNRS